MFLDVLVAIAFFFGMYYFGLKGSTKVQTDLHYLMGDRKTSLLPLTATLVMTEFNTATLLSFCSMGFLAGNSALWLPLVFLVGLLFYAAFVAKKWKEFDGISVAQFFTKRYGKGVGFIATWALLLAMVGFSAAYVKSLYLIAEPFFPTLSPWALSSLLVAAILLMVLRGGLFSIIRTDLFTFFVTLFFFPILAYFSCKIPDSEVTTLTQITLPPKFIISLIVLTMFTYILAPWYGQKIFAAKNQKTAFLSVAFAAILVFILYSLGVLACSFMRQSGFELSNPETALPHAISSLPFGLKGLGFSILFAASATTLTGVWSAMSGLLMVDVSKNRGFKRSFGLTLFFALFSLILANVLVDRVFDKIILANIPVAALSFALLAGFYSKRAGKLSAYVSIVVSLTWSIFCYLYFGESGGYTWYWAVIGIPLTFISGFITFYLFESKLTSRLIN